MVVNQSCSMDYLKKYYFIIIYVILSCLKLDKIIYINNYYSWVGLLVIKYEKEK